MGNCSTCSSTQVATAKLVLHDGRLQEYSYPVKASYVLQKYPMCFICNSDEMDFDDVVAAIDDDEELQPGQLYFALPLTRLNHRLQPQEMAALAVKASSALMKTSDREKCGCSRNQNIVFSAEHKKMSYKKVSPGAGGGGRTRRPKSGEKFTAILSAIPE
ncbi:HTH-type transcriptional regulator [Senna tora]|uniref:HTH-type transcriptional regulator n=1 Tax=Senna tora TaxID=362788 RepID=A0A834U2Q5_9FABA|nr:HTH-type transcriptional regulator [Senna tora]